MARVEVCTSTDCGGKDSLLVHDIEELCDGKARIVSGGCFNKCGKGPNIKIQREGKDDKIVEGITDYKKAEKFVKSELGIKLSGVESTVGALRYDARRTKMPHEQAEKVKKAITAMGGEDKAGREKPRATAQLLAMRARAVVSSKPDDALKDGQKAVTIFQECANAHAVIAAVLEIQGKFEEALEAVEKAVSVGGVLMDAKWVYPLQQRIKEKAGAGKQEEEAKRKAEEEAAQKSADDAAAAEKAAAAEAAEKKKAEAKKKAELDKKRKAAAAAAAKKKAELAAKKEAEAKALEEAEAAAAAEAVAAVNDEVMTPEPEPEEGAPADEAPAAVAEEPTEAQREANKDAEMEAQKWAANLQQVQIEQGLKQYLSERETAKAINAKRQALPNNRPFSLFTGCCAAKVAEDSAG